MSSRFWTSLLVSVLVAALTCVVTHRLFGVAFLFLPLCFAGGGGRKER